MARSESDERRTALTRPSAGAITRRANKGNGSPPARRPEAPTTASLIKEAFTDSIGVLQAHVELAVLEVREDANAAVRVAAAFGVGAALTMLAAGFLLAAAAFGLALVIPAWAACCIVGGVVMVAAAIAFSIARRKLKTHDFRPERTLATLQEDREWIAGKTS